MKYEMWCVRKVLIIAPKKVAESTWTKEAAKWTQLQGLRFSLVMGTQAQRLRALEATADIYLINRENTQWLVRRLGRDWCFDMVVLDESSSFKNHQAKRFKALKLVRPLISRIVELTGTPNPRGLTDLWAQLYLLDGGKRLGRTVSVYRDLFFVPDKRNRTTVFSYAPKPGAAEEIYRRISDICVSMKSEDYLSLPELIYDDIPVVLDPAAKKVYDRLERDMLLTLDDDTVITAGSAAVLRGKLLQLCNGAVYDEDGAVVPLHNCKIEALLETVEQLGGQHAIICYNFRHDRQRLLEALSATRLRVAVYEGKAQEEAWNAGEIDLLLVQPASCGYGLNLQNGGHHVIWFGLTDSLELYQQTNKRLHRQGQPYPVIVHHLLVQGGTDEDVIRALGNKADVQDSLLEALKERIQKAKEARR
jgi:SNF2 family DNA or RNA helicase